ncbi:MAG: glycoside hydrolase family 3 N-terminal domain-containing protein [Candidatus Merdivicinus sp.]|jgi:beta-N-acetylhexosaminidase
MSHYRRKFYRSLLAVLLIALLAGSFSYAAVWICGELGQIGQFVQPAGGFPSQSSSLSSQENLDFSVESTAESSQLMSESDRFEAYYSQAETILAQMTVSEKIGQLFLVDFPDGDPQEWISQYHPAGLILFSKTISNQTPDSLRELLADCNAWSKIPLTFAVDEEGGEVVRISQYSAFRQTPFSSPQSLIQQGGIDALAADALEKSEFLLDLGIQLNLAPVCDVAETPQDYIYSRTLGLDAEQTAEGITAIVTAMEQTGISCALKHFPGYGGNPDTHSGTAMDSRSYSELSQRDFLPFQAGIQAGAEIVLVSHNTLTALDPQYPASLSPEIHRILREDLNFTGIIATDDLEMDALDSYGENAALLAFEAGNNLILIKDLPAGVAAIQSAVDDGSITEEMLDAAIKPTIAWKLEKNIFPSN